MPYEITAYWSKCPNGRTCTVPDERCLKHWLEAIEQAAREAGITVRIRVKKSNTAQRTATVRRVDKEYWGVEGARSGKRQTVFNSRVADQRCRPLQPSGRVPNRADRSPGEEFVISLLWVSLQVGSVGLLIGACADGEDEMLLLAALLLISAGLLWPVMLGIAMLCVKVEEKAMVPIGELFKIVGISVLNSLPKIRCYRCSSGHQLARRI